jgi:hypothetical protein
MYNYDITMAFSAFYVSLLPNLINTTGIRKYRFILNLSPFCHSFLQILLIINCLYKKFTFCIGK